MMRCKNIFGFFCVMCFLFVFLVAGGQAAGEKREKISVSQSAMKFSRLGQTDYVQVIGLFKSDSPYDITDIVAEVRFFDEKGALIDTIYESYYGLVLPAKGEVGFNLRTSRSAEEEQYVRYQVSILSFDEDIPCPPRSWRSNLLKLSEPIGIVLFYIFIIIIFVRVAERRSTAYTKSLLGYVEQQTESLKKMADALEKRNNQ